MGNRYYTKGDLMRCNFHWRLIDGRWPKLVLLVVFFCLGCFTQARSHAAEPEATFQGKIVYFGNRKDKQQVIETSNLDGTGLTTILELRTPLYTSGRVSPDSRHVAYSLSTTPEGRPQLWLLTSQGESEKLLDDAGWVAAWSPDGKQIVFYWGDRENRESSIVDVETRQVKRIPLPTTNVVDGWTPDGRTVTVIEWNASRVFTRQDGEVYPLRALYTAKVDGTRIAPLTFNPDGDFIWSTFSPDGQRLALYQRLQHDGKTFEYAVVANADGQNPKEVLNFTEMDANNEIRPNGRPCWMPDGKSMLWQVTSQPKGSDNFIFKYVVIPIDGSAVRWLQPDQERNAWGGIDCR
jgi:Tol biopolymer transport system component